MFGECMVAIAEQGGLGRGVMVGCYVNSGSRDR